MDILKRKIDLNQESEPFSLKKGCDLLTKCKKNISLHCDKPKRWHWILYKLIGFLVIR